jgi:CubicO group peptidase (beta-lactamase class C family)
MKLLSMIGFAPHAGAGTRWLARCCLWASALAMLGGCPETARRESAERAAYWPVAGWRTSTPERQGVDSARLLQAVDYVRTQGLDLDSLLLVRNGHLVLEAYFHPYPPELAQDVASVTKSVTASLVGIAVRLGAIQSLDQPVLGFFPERVAANLDANKRAMTVRHLLTMSSGLRCGGPGEPEQQAMTESRDWVQFALDLPMAAAPGTVFAYCSPGSHLLAAIVARATGMSVQQFAQTQLFTPLGIEPPTWPLDPQGVAHGWGDLRLHPRDMAKIGYLYLHEGLWNGQRILPPDWVADTTRPHTSVPTSDADYGNGWWLPRGVAGLYEARGRGGQYVSVLPAKDLVVAWTGSADDRDRLGELLLAAIQERGPLPENPQAAARLAQRLAEIRQPAPPLPVAALPPMALRISQRRYALADNAYRIAELSLAFAPPAQAQLSLVTPQGAFTLPVGLDGNYRSAATGPTGFATATRGRWRGEQEFTADIKDLGGPNRFRLGLSFAADQLIMTVDDATGLLPRQHIAGRARN